MADTWKHPTIGEFRRDQFGWLCNLPSIWSGFFPFCDEEQTPIEIEFVSRNENEPSSEALEQLENFWANRNGVPKAICEYLWSEIQGEITGRNWWSWMEQNEWEELLESKGVSPPDSEQDLFEHLAIPAVTVRHFPEEAGEQLTINPFTGEKIANPKPPSPPSPPRAAYWAVECAFRCVWEEEHGIAAFWRNGEVIGTDYGDGQGIPPDDYAP